MLWTTIEMGLIVRRALQGLKLLEELKNVEVILEKPLEGFKLATTEVRGGKKGTKVVVPLWVARELLRSKVATLNLEAELSWLGRIHWREKVQAPQGIFLSKLPEDFYSKSKLILHFLRALPVIDYRVSQARSLREEVVERRLHVISDLVHLGDLPVEMKERMVESELTLFESLKELMRAWIEEVAER